MNKLSQIAIILTLLVIGVPSWAVYGVRIRDLQCDPLPPNPVRVWGTVVAVEPVRISDGTHEITVNDIPAVVGDYIIATGDWDGVAVTPNGPVEALVGPARMRTVYVPAGSFLMGNNGSEPYSNTDELPQHSVHLSGYWIGKYEVTRGEYREFIKAGGYSNPAYWSTAGWSWKVSISRTQPDYWDSTQNWGSPPGTFTQTDSHPVVSVTYYEAEAYCAWAGGHLPTEAQWEKAARWTGSHPKVYPWGDVWDAQKCNNWYDDLYPGCQTAPVGSYPAGVSPYGCQDMVGNVYEWCKDWYLSSYYSQTPPGGWIDPQGPSSGSCRVLRGGGWGSYDYLCRCALRDYYYPNHSFYDFGFRFAR